MLRDVSRFAPIWRRCISNKPPIVDLTVDNEGIAVMTLQRPPVNSFNKELLNEIRTALATVEKNKNRGLVITSALPKVFSAGLDLNELYPKDEKTIEATYSTIQDCIRDLATTNFPIAAAINGHTSAGGCLATLACEYRVMVDGKSTIGIQDTALNIAPALSLVHLVTYVIGHKNAERILTLSTMFSPTEALKIGLIDELAVDKEDCIEKCKIFIRKFHKISPFPRAMTKANVRSHLIKYMDENKMAELKDMAAYLSHPEVQKMLGSVLEKLKKK